MRILAVLLALLLFSASVYAQERLTIDLAKDRVDITTGFDGAELVLYGVKDKNVDVAVSIEGPLKTTVVRKKGQVFGAWMNTLSMTFENVPGFYAYALSKPESSFKPNVLKAHNIGLNALFFEPADAPPQQENIKLFQEAMIRNKQTQQLFPLNAQPVIFLDDGFFKTSIYIPSNVPVGMYTVRTLLLDDAKVIQEKALKLKVAQVGMSAKVYEFATNQSLYYGVLCVFMALFAGWLINFIRNR
ncbi:MAG: TIGR02186 family protein [Alphaproteobacteria bacterium]